MKTLLSQNIYNTNTRYSVVVSCSSNDSYGTSGRW